MTHYEQNFVTETMFYFCPKQQCINNIPHWTNLKPPDRIRADSSFNDVTIAALKDNGLPLLILLTDKKILGVDVFELRGFVVCCLLKGCV